MNKDKISQIITPTKVELFFCFLLGLTFVLFGIRNQLTSFLTGGVFQPTEANQIISSYVTVFLNNVGEQRFANTITLALFWATVGFAIYLVFLAIVNIGIFIYDQYLLTTSYTNQQSGVRGEFLKRHLVKISIIVSLLVLASLVIQLIYPITIGTVNTLFISSQVWTIWLMVAIIFLVFVGCIYFIYSLTRLAFTNLYE